MHLKLSFIMSLPQMKACERTSETSHHETYSLICIVAQIALLFCRQRSEHSALDWGK